MRMWRAAEEEREARVRLEREIARRDRARVRRRERRGREGERDGEGEAGVSLEVDGGVGVAGRGGGGKKGKGRVAKEGRGGLEKERKLDLGGTGTGTAYDETSSLHGAREAWQPPAQHPCLRVGSDTGAYTTGTDALTTSQSEPAAAGLRRRRSDESDLRTGSHHRPPRPREPEPEPEPEPPGVLKGKASDQSMSTHFTETLRRIQEAPPRRRRMDRVDVHGMRW
jgi:hypothetical protein